MFVKKAQIKKEKNGSDMYNTEGTGYKVDKDMSFPVLKVWS